VIRRLVSSRLPLRLFGRVHLGSLSGVERLRADTVASRRRRLSELVSERTNRVVQAGLFEGTVLPPSAAWGADDYAAMLLGTYEQELHDPLRTCLELSPDAVVNLGCASGLYAAGLARKLPGCPVTANDLATNALAATSRAWELNHLERTNRLELFHGAATFRRLSAWLEPHRLPLVVCDIEGSERQLLDPVAVPQLATSIIVCELHEHRAPGTTALLERRLAPTHHITHIASQARNPHELALLADIEENDRWLAVSEARHRSGNWMLAIPNRCHPRASTPTSTC
jgi:hypothetical protein